MVLPTSDYQNLLDSYFPDGVRYDYPVGTDQPPPGDTPIPPLIYDQDYIWQQFLQTYGILSEAQLDNIKTQKLFHEFVQKTYTEFALLTQSSDEIKGRHVISTIFDILILLMKTIQDNASILQNTILILAKRQKEYGDQMARIGFYRGGSSNTGSPDLTDLSRWTLGYAGITIDDYILSSLVPRTLDPGEEDQTPVPVTGYQEVHLNADSGSVPITLQAVFPPHPSIGGNISNRTLGFEANDTSFTVTYTVRLPLYDTDLNVNNVVFPITQTVTFDADATLEEKIDAARGAFFTLLNQTAFADPSTSIQYSIGGGKTLGDFITSPNMLFHQAWDNQLNRPYDQDNSGTKAQTRGGEARAAKNQLLQQYLENARTRKGVLADMQDTMETTFDSTKDALSRSADIINSTIKQLINIITSIYRIV